ncbi:MAG: hypothetical protein EOM87_03230 [Clostridia bacterium]|nr:hypothetical protein [Clostridia bacterium]
MKPSEVCDLFLSLKEKYKQYPDLEFIFWESEQCPPGFWVWDSYENYKKCDNFTLGSDVDKFKKQHCLETVELKGY